MPDFSDIQGITLIWLFVIAIGVIIYAERRKP